MAKDPAFLFYSSDFLTGTMFMTNEQVGKYIRLMCIQHQKGHLNEKDMLNICSTYDADVFNKFDKDEQGLYYNKRLENEVQRRKDYAESRRQNRLKNKNISESYVPHMETENEIENETIDSIVKTIPIVEEAKPKRDKKPKQEIEKNPFQDQALNENWQDWIQFRSEIKEELTPIAAKKQINFLSKYPSQTAIEIIDRSIQNKWRGLFPIEQATVRSITSSSKQMVD